MGANERAESDLSIRIAASVGPNETVVRKPDETASETGPPQRLSRPTSDTPGRVPTTVDEALRLAVKLALDGGDYERAAEVLGVLKRHCDGSRGYRGA